MKEGEFQQQVEDLAKLFKWRFYHTHDSRRSEPGFPDLVMVRESRLIFAELKTDAKSSQPTAAQTEWLLALRVVAEYAQLARDDPSLRPIEVFVWRPSDWDGIVETLR